MSDQIGITFGALCDPIHKQINADEELIRPFQQCADAVVLLIIQGYISDSVARKARQRIVNKIWHELRRVKKARKA